jgi:predicted Zn-ribbon and HTH transcriptional regulator
MRTVRQQMMELLAQQELNALELSQALHVMEKEVYGHLEHIRRSLSRQKDKKLVVTPYRCLGCGYVFHDRTRLDRPGRCPRCREGHIRLAGFRIEDRSRR